MGFLDWLGLTRESVQPEPQTSDLAEIVRKYDIIDVQMNEGHPFVIVADKEQPGKTFSEDSPDLRELGSSAPSPFTSGIRKEYNRELLGLNGLKKYDVMRKSHGVVRGTLRTIKTPVLAARWFVEPASDKKRDQNAADFIWRCLADEMSISWSQVLVEALLCVDFGHYMFEIVWEERIIDGVERLIWSKLAPRHPMDIKEWKYDAQGGPDGVVMYVPKNEYDVDEKFIPIEKLLVFTFDREAGNIEGISALRSAYKHWFFNEQLSKIDAIQKERHGIGVPIIKLPPGFTDADKLTAQALGANLRTNERAHVVLPPNWEIMFAKLEGNPVSALESMKYHDSLIRENVLASFQNSDSPTKEEDQTMFLKATRFIADIICETFNTYAIPKLIEANFERVGTPKLRARRIGEQQDWRTLSFALRNLVGAGLIRPDDRLERWLRDEMDLPMPELETVRVVATPQAGQPSQPQPGDQLPNATPGTQEQKPGVKQNTNTNTVGMPRQTPPSPVVPRPQGPGGRDASGGK